MIPANPGNLLPFYEEGYANNDFRWQRHRQFGTDIVPYGLPCPRTRLMAFQLTFEGATPTLGDFTWYLVNAADEGEVIVLDVNQLELVGTGSRWWLTWYAEQDLSAVPDCGYWYFVVELPGGSAKYGSEVMEARNMCGAESGALSIVVDSCTPPVEGDFTFVLEATVSAFGGVSYQIQRGNGIIFVTLSTDEAAEVTEAAEDEAATYRLFITSECGLTKSIVFDATWEEADPCGTIALTPGAETVIAASGYEDEPYTWRLTFENGTDKATVLYQNGYKQSLYLPVPVWDVPETEREIEVAVNGNGEEIRRFTRTVERRGFEAADIPDYVLGFLAKAGDLSDVRFEDLKTGVGFYVENLTFESPNRQGVGLNIGRFYFDVEAEAFQGCQEDFVLEE